MQATPQCRSSDKDACSLSTSYCSYLTQYYTNLNPELRQRPDLVEKFVNYDKSDYRVDIVDGEFIACYGRKAPENDWKTNITSGGSVILREPNDEVVELAKKAAKVTGLEIAGVDIIYDLDKERYIVLEVNGIPAFATPEQEKMGLNFNDKKIEAIVNLIEKKVKGKK